MEIKYRYILWNPGVSDTIKQSNKCDMQWVLRVDFDGCLGRNFKKENSMYTWHARNQCKDDEWHRGLRRI